MPDEKTDLTSPAAVKAGQKVYDQIKSGQVKDVGKALDQAHGRKPKG